VLATALAATAFVAGLTGTWSPCGFSMIETIGPVGHRGSRATTVSACLTFTLGALAGGALTFGLLAVAGGAVHGADVAAAYVAATGIALAAAVAELRGVAILPQVRRQLPEPWRRSMPMPLAAGLYGVLLGLGFTTFVLTFGVFALAGIVFALGEPALGIAVGLGFALGRALPIALVAPVADREAGIRVTDAMAQRPAIYRGFRLGDGLALLLVAGALAVAVPAGASRTEAGPAADPSVDGRDLAFQRPDGSGFMLRGGRSVALPGHDPALGDGRVAVIRRGRIGLLSAVDLSEIGSIPAAGADAVAISRHWVVWRSRRHGRDSMHARRVAAPEHPGPVRSLGRAGRRAQLGRPSLDDNRLVYARAGAGQNLILERTLGSRRGRRAERVLIRSRTQGLSNPVIRGRDLLYVRTARRADRLILTRARDGRGRVLLSRRHGRLWSTALDARRAYVTLLEGRRPRSRILSVPR
jgi:hypothetical protein